MADWVRHHEYIEVFPVSTARYSLEIHKWAQTWPPSQDDAPWPSEGGDANEKAVNNWYAQDLGDYFTEYDFDGSPPTSDPADVEYFSGVFSMVASAHWQSNPGRFFAVNGFTVFDLSQIPEGPYSRMAFVADMSAVNSSLGGDPDEPENTFAGFSALPGVSPFGADIWDHRADHLDTFSGFDVAYSYAQIESGNLHDPVTAPRTIIEFPRMMNQRLIPIRMHCFMGTGVPINNNNVFLSNDVSAVDGLVNDTTVNSEWYERAIFSMPALRLWRGGENTLDLRGQAQSTGQFRPYQEREVLDHRARLRRGGA